MEAKQVPSINSNKAQTHTHNRKQTFSSIWEKIIMRSCGARSMEEEEEDEPKIMMIKPNGKSISDLSDNDLIDIFLKLPAKSIFLCRCVCKPWFNLLSDPYFKKLLLTRSPISFIFQNPKKTLYLGELNSHEIAFNAHLDFPTSELRIGNSANGLVCLCEPLYGSPIWVWNPLLGEFTTIPLDKGSKKYVVASGFGYISEMNLYKVVRVFHGSSGGGEIELKVHTIGTKSWRTIGYFPYFICGSSRAFVNDSLHWFNLNVGDLEILCCFNIKDEDFHTIELPPRGVPNRVDKRKYSYGMSLGVLRDCLCLCRVDPFDDQFEIWVMKEYGIKESWSKDFVIRVPSGLWSGWKMCTPIGILGNGDIVLMRNNEAMFFYNPIKGTLGQIRMNGIGSQFMMVVHVPSFVSLRDVVEEELEVQSFNSISS